MRHPFWFALLALPLAGCFASEPEPTALFITMNTARFDPLTEVTIQSFDESGVKGPQLLATAPLGTALQFPREEYWEFDPADVPFSSTVTLEFTARFYDQVLGTAKVEGIPLRIGRPTAISALLK